MSPKKITAGKTSDATELRHKAEQKLLGRKNNAASSMNETDNQRLVHELQVHQIELEMQNEELKQARAESEAALRQYADLYDFAPVVYFTLARDGRILKTNLAGAALLGTERSKLIERRFGLFVSVESRPVFSAFLERGVKNQGSDTCEVALIKNEKKTLWVSIDAIWSEEKQEFHAVVVDITERKQADEALQKSNAFLESIIEQSSNAIWISDENGTLVELSHLDVNDQNLTVTISIGATRLRPDDTPESIVDRADRLMYQSKKAGRNFVTIG